MLTLNAVLPSQHSFLQNHNRCRSARCALLCTYTFSLFVFTLIKCIFCFSFPSIQERTIKLVFPKITFAVLFLIILNYFSFFPGATFETTLSCTLVVTWNYFVDYQAIQIGSRTTVTSKMERFVSFLWQLPFFNNCHKDLHLRCCKRPQSHSYNRHFPFAELDLNQFDRSIDASNKKDGWLLWDGNTLISSRLRKQLCTRCSVNV